MEKIKIDLTEVVAEVKKLGAENPDFVYSAPAHCSYITQGECPPCIVGQALQNLGVPAEALEAEESGIGDAGVAVFLDPEREDSIFEVFYSYGELNYLASVQDRQDSEIPWGQAVAA